MSDPATSQLVRRVCGATPAVYSFCYKKGAKDGLGSRAKPAVEGIGLGALYRWLGNTLANQYSCR